MHIAYAGYIPFSFGGQVFLLPPLPIYARNFYHCPMVMVALGLLGST